MGYNPPLYYESNIRSCKNAYHDLRTPDVRDALRRLSGMPPAVGIVANILDMSETTERILRERDSGLEHKLALPTLIRTLALTANPLHFMPGEKRVTGVSTEDIFVFEEYYAAETHVKIDAPDSLGRVSNIMIPQARTTITKLTPNPLSGKEEKTSNRYLILAEWANPIAIGDHTTSPNQIVFGTLHVQATEIYAKGREDISVLQCSINPQKGEVFLSLPSDSYGGATQKSGWYDFDGYPQRQWHRAG